MSTPLHLAEQHQRSSSGQQHGWASPPQATRSEAKAKAIIVGEHAVVYGAKAIAMPIDTLHIKLELTPRHEERGVRFCLGGRPVPEHLAGVVDDAMRCLGIKPYSLDIAAQSNILIGAGVGSSAALCIGVLRALADAHQLKLSKEKLAHFGNQLEKRFHGNPSGLDTAVVAMETVIAFQKGKAPTPITVAKLGTAGALKPWPFALIDTGVRSSTMTMIQVAASYFQGRLGEQRLAAFNQLATDAEQGLGTGEPALVARAMRQAAMHLDAAGVVNVELKAAMQAAEAAGALAAKPTGAGGGGCVLALFDPKAGPAPLAELAQRVQSGPLSQGRVIGVNL